MWHMLKLGGKTGHTASHAAMQVTFWSIFLVAFPARKLRTKLWDQWHACRPPFVGVEGVFVGFQSIAHSPKSRADGQAFHSFPHPGSCAGYACKALFWARFEHMFVQHRTISNYFEMLVRFCSILFRRIRHIWDLWVYCTFGGIHRIHLPSGQSARRKARLLSAKRCMALSWADDITTWWPAKADLVKHGSAISEYWEYIQLHTQCIRATSNCMHGCDGQQTHTQTRTLGYSHAFLDCFGMCISA